MLPLRHYTHLTLSSTLSYSEIVLIFSDDANEAGTKENDLTIRSSFPRDDVGECVEFIYPFVLHNNNMVDLHIVSLADKKIRQRNVCVCFFAAFAAQIRLVDR